MKGVKSIMAALVSTLLSACTSSGKLYEKTIADYVQTDKHGTWTDLHFKVLSMETENCTVEDSIHILYEDAIEEKEKAVKFATERLEYWKKQVENPVKGFGSGMINDVLRENMTKAAHRLDSLRSLQPITPVHYQELDPDMLLAVYVTCKYGINLPYGGNAYQERTDVFVLSPDGKSVLGKERKKR